MLDWTGAKHYSRWGDRLILSAWLGTVALASFLLLASLVVPLSPAMGILIALQLVILVLLLPSGKRGLETLLSGFSSLLFWDWGLIVVLLLAIALLSQGATLSDTGLYHLQLVQWLGRVGAVPGLALLHDRFGFTSTWFALSASFSAGDRLGAMVGLLGGYATLLAALHTAIAARHLLKDSPARVGDWFILISSAVTLPAAISMRALPSTSPNLPIIFLVILVSWVLIESRPGLATANLLLLLSAGAVAIKLSALPLALVAFVYALVQTWKRPIRLLRSLIFPALLVLPVVLVSLVVSGCPLFPLPFLCIDGLPWAVGSAHAKAIASNVGQFGLQQAGGDVWVFLFKRRPHAGFLLVCSTLAAALLLWALRPKFVRHARSAQNPGFSVGSPDAPELRALRAKFARSSPEEFLLPGCFPVMCIALLGILMIARAGYNLRFGLAYLLLLPAYLAAVYAQRRSPFASLSLFVVGASGATIWKPNPWLTAALMVISIAAAAAGLKLAWRKSPRNSLQVGFIVFLILAVSGNFVLKNPVQFTWVWPSSSVPHPEQVELVLGQSNDVPYGYPAQGLLCWTAPLICTPAPIEGVRMRNPERSLRGGFVRTNTPQN
ncbi:MAG: hypothetical protein SNJ57_21235 [Cyanobacteriota bacterium]